MVASLVHFDTPHTIIAIFPSLTPPSLSPETSHSELTCQVGEPQVSQPGGAVLGVVEQDGEGEVFVVQRVPADDPQLVQGNVLHLVHADEDVACHLADGLEGRRQSSG